MVFLYVFGFLLISQLLSASPLIHHEYLTSRQAATNKTSLSKFVNTISLERYEADALLNTLQNDEDLETFLAGDEYDKSQLARLTCGTLKQTFAELSKRAGQLIPPFMYTHRLMNPSIDHRAAWGETSLRTFCNGLIVRLSTRVFFGKGLFQNQEYLDHVVSWGTLVLIVNITLRRWPLFLRKLVHVFHPLSRQLRNERAATSKIVAPIIDERLEQKQQRKTSAKVSDMVGWMEEIVQKKKAKVDLVDGQLFMAFVAVETTSTTVAYLLLDLLDCPDAIPRLRKEIISVLREGRWKKTSLQQMKLLDSAMKESQRLHPLSLLNMQRKVIQGVTLSDGTVLPKGAHTFVRWESRCSPETYPNPDKFVVDRFLKKRESEEAGASSKWQFVTTSPEHMGFGHGRQACPGRFFASNEIKVAMVHLLLKYDWAYSGDGRKLEQVVSNIPIMSYEQKLAFRRRELEDGLEL